MKCTNSYLLWLLCLIPSSDAFTPIQLHNRASLSKLNFGSDPSVFHFHDLSNPIASSWSTFQVAVDAATDIASNIPSDGVVEASTDAAAAGSGNGWFGFLEAPIEGLLQLCHSSLVSMGMSANAWGLSILLMTTLIKVLTFPLTKTQLESTNKMQV
jgi:YidC/Oxa1 family membrane protein insertase